MGWSELLLRPVGLFQQRAHLVDPMIEVRNLTKSYLHKGKRVKVFENLNFCVEKGHSVALLGRNGAGKSTLLRIIGGIDQPDSGTIQTDCSISWPVGLVGGFQGSLTARENVTFVSKIYAGHSSELIEEKVRRVEEFAEIGVYFDRPFKTYSSGMRSRVTFGLSMAFDFDVYLIDEVTSAGDERFRARSRRVLEERHQVSDFMMVDHNLWGLQFHCDRALLLHDGGIIEFDSLREGIAMHKSLLESPISADLALGQ
jgi:capsular polysaccharide transport system ATP-binding protein